MRKIELLLDILDLIFQERFEKDNWESVLNKIARLFDADIVALGFTEGNKYIVYKCLNSFGKNLNFDPEKGKVNIDRLKKYYLKNENDEFVIINDYQNFPYAIDYYKKIGIKTLLLSLIKDKDFYFGNLAIANLSKKEFTKKDGEISVRIAKLISQILKIKYLSEKLKKYNEFLEKQITIFKNLSTPQKSNLYNWFLELFKEISSLFGLSYALLYFPKQNLGCQYISNSSLYMFEERNIWDIFLRNIYIEEDPLEKILENVKDCKTFSNVKLKTIKDIRHLKLYETSCQNLIILKLILYNQLDAIGIFGFEKDISGFEEDILKFLQTILLFLSLILNLVFQEEKYKNIISPSEEDLILSFLKIIEARDLYTKGHSLRVALYAQKIGEYLFDKDFGRKLYIAGLFHDIGKIGIPDQILFKPGKLTEYEYEIIKYHSILSYELIKNIPHLEEIKPIVLHHHEKWDGSGYPKGLKGEEIPLGARILTIADIFDALTSERSYRKALSVEEALKLISDLAGKELDPNLTPKAIPILEKYSKYIKNLSFSSFIPEEIERIKREYFERDIISRAFIRKRFFKEIENLINKNFAFSVILFDIKNTLELNYKFGEDYVDSLFEKLVALLTKNFNFYFISRLGGDEFGIIKLREDVGKKEIEFFTKMLKEFVKQMLDLEIKVDYLLYPEDAKNYENLKEKIFDIEKRLRK